MLAPEVAQRLLVLHDGWVGELGVDLVEARLYLDESLFD